VFINTLILISYDTERINKTGKSVAKSESENSESEKASEKGRNMHIEL